jgi:hypothetical protein
MDKGKYIQKIAKYTEQLYDNVYLMGKWITKITDKMIPGKIERRERALRTYVNKLLDGELTDEELVKLGFQASNVKGTYVSALGMTAVGIATLNPLLFVCAGGAGVLGVLHQTKMSKNLKNEVDKISEEQRKELKELLKVKDAYQFRDVLYNGFGF